MSASSSSLGCTYSPAGTELWRTDGTVRGTSRVADINKGSGSSNPANFISLSNYLYFSATDTILNFGRRLYRISENNSMEIEVINKINYNATNSLQSAVEIENYDPIDLTIFSKDQIFFSAYDNYFGRELCFINSSSSSPDTSIQVYNYICIFN